MRYRMVSVRNVQRLIAAGDALVSRAPGMPGMGLVFGPSGYGKSTATAYWTNQMSGVYVRAMALWSPAAMLDSILVELDRAGGGSNARKIDLIVRSLAQADRPLIVDEADYLAESKRLTETLRDIHDLSTQPVILVGMDGLPRKLAEREQLVGRVAQWVKFEPADLGDAKKLAAELAEVEVADELVADLHDAARGSIRRIVVGLTRVESTARAKGLKRISRGEWGNRKFFLHDAPEETRSPLRLAARNGGAE